MNYCGGVGQKGLVDCDPENGQCEICYMADLEEENEKLKEEVDRLSSALNQANHMLADAEAENEALRRDADRYRKIQRWMSSNVKEGWREVESMGALCSYMSWNDMDQYLDALPVCNVGICKISSPENQ